LNKVFAQNKTFIMVVLFSGLLFSVGMVLAYVFWLSGSALDEGYDPENLLLSEEEVVKKPSFNELTSTFLFQGERVFNLKADKDTSVNYLKIQNIELICFKKVPGIKKPMERIEGYKNRLREQVSIFFQGVNAQDIVRPEGRESMKMELLHQMNQVINNIEGTESDWIYDIIIENWLYG
jgi:flagellar basal body-associated protein FliL